MRRERSAYLSEWYRRNRESRLEYHAAYREARREHLAEKQRAYYQKNREAILQREQESDRRRRDDEAYVQRERERAQERSSRRRARMRSAPVVDLTSSQWDDIKDRFGHRCAYCGAKENLTQDHVVALAVGGSHTAANVVPACFTCNRRKGIDEAPPLQLPIGAVVA